MSSAVCPATVQYLTVVVVVLVPLFAWIDVCSGWLNHSKHAQPVSGLCCAFAIVPICVVALLTFLSMSWQSVGFALDVTTPLYIDSDVSCAYTVLTSDEPTMEGMSLLTVLGSSQVVADEDANHVTIRRVSRAYSVAELKHIGQECYVMLVVAPDTKFPDLHFNFSQARPDFGTSVNRIMAFGAQLSNVDVVSDGEVSFEIYSSQITADHLNVDASLLHFHAEGFAFTGSSASLNLALASGSVSVAVANSAVLDLDLVDESNILQYDGSYACVSGSGVSCATTNATSGDDCTSYEIVNAKNDTLPPIDATVTWTQQDELEAIVHPYDQAPHIRWVQDSNAGTVDEVWRTTSYPQLSFDADLMSNIADAVSFGYEFIEVSVPGNEFYKWALVPSDDFFGSKISPPVLDLLSVGTLSPKTYRAFLPAPVGICPSPTSLEEYERLPAAIFEQLSVIADGDYTVMFKNESAGVYQTYLDSPHTQARELKTIDIAQDPTLVVMLVMMVLCACSVGLYVAVWASEEVQELLGNEIFRFYHLRGFPYALRDMQNEVAGRPPANAKAHSGCTRLLNDAERDTNDCGLFLFSAVASNDNTLFAAFKHRFVWEDWQFLRPFRWHVCAALRSMAASAEPVRCESRVDIDLF